MARKQKPQNGLRVEVKNNNVEFALKKFKKMGRDLVQLVEIEDEDKRTLRMVGDVKANAALKDRYFNNFLIKTVDIKTATIKAFFFLIN